MPSPVQVYYDERRIVPAPTITINKEFIYSNDAIIGYTYVFNLQGYASSINTKLNTTNSTLQNTIKSLEDIQTTLHRNGKYFRVTCPDSGTDLIRAYGGQLRSFDVQETENKWVQYAQYSAQIEFSQVLFNGTNVEIASDSTTGTNNNTTFDLLKLKSYNDNWNFTISEEDMYRFYTSENMMEDYTQIQVEYTVNATGKHFYLDQTNQTIPAWVAAKNFVQEKMYDQLSLFYNSSPLGYFTFPNTNYDSNESSGPLLNNAHSYNAGVSAFPILGQGLPSWYRIFNEKISCSTSETEGSFSATYSCTLRFTNYADNGGEYTMDYATHTFDVSYEKNRSFDASTTNITVNGTVTGMLRTNILATAVDGQVFRLPSNGVFLASAIDIGNKYYNALVSFNNQLANADHSDLKDDFKTRLYINYATLFPETTSNPCGGNLAERLAEPKSFTVTHNYNEGSITYNAEYDNERSCAAERGFQTLTITEEDPVPIIAEFIIPGRENGPVIQNLNTYSHKKVTLEFSGTTRKGCDTGTPWAPGFSGSNLCDTASYVHIPDKVELMLTQTENAASCSLHTMLATSHNINYNPVNGDYSVSKSYTICPYNPDAPPPPGGCS